MLVHAHDSKGRGHMHRNTLFRKTKHGEKCWHWLCYDILRNKAIIWTQLGKQPDPVLMSTHTYSAVKKSHTWVKVKTSAKGKVTHVNSAWLKGLKYQILNVLKYQKFVIGKKKKNPCTVILTWKVLYSSIVRVKIQSALLEYLQE